MKFHIENMTCGGCAKSVSKAIATIDPNCEINFDIPKRTIEFATEKSADLFAHALASEGYPAVSI